MTRIEEAREVCRTAHAGQFDKAGKEYWTHPFHVAETLTKWGADEDTVIVGLLHDVLEDSTRFTEPELREKFGDRAADALLCMTHRKGVPYMEYVEKISRNPVARKVKLADLDHNMDTSRLPDGKLPPKLPLYRQAKAYLELVEDLAAAKETAWLNPGRCPMTEVPEQPLTLADIEDAEARLRRFAPFLMKAFPETIPAGGLIESELVPIPNMAEKLGTPGTLLLKKDSELPIAGSVKARGGIYEVLKHAETLALEHGLLTENGDYAVLAEPDVRAFFSQYTVQVGSTGNLGMSIGIMSAAFGFKTIIHMSADVKQWKKDLLRARGCTVMEYPDDYSAAVANGRRLSDADPMSYFVDDENSKDLFLGYAVAALRVKKQLEERNIPVDAAHPLFITIPCGVGGAPGGITFGLRQVFGDNVHPFFAEPVQAPCMLLGMASGRQHDICVKDIGLTGLTEADGLAVGRPSGFVGQMMVPHLCGEFTVSDDALFRYLGMLWKTEKTFIEPSSCAAFRGGEGLYYSAEGKEYLTKHDLLKHLNDSAHIVWATGGRLVPEKERQAFLTRAGAFDVCPCGERKLRDKERKQ